MTVPTQTPEASSEPETSGEDAQTQASAVQLEALQMITGESLATQAEAHTTATQAQDYQDYVTQYTEAAAEAWAETMQNFQAEMDAWRGEPSTAEGDGTSNACSQLSGDTDLIVDKLNSLKEALLGSDDEGDEGDADDTSASDEAAPTDSEQDTEQDTEQDPGDSTAANTQKSTGSSSKKKT